MSKFINSVKPGSQVFTQEGVPVRIICIDRKGRLDEEGKELSIIALVQDPSGEKIITCNEDGLSSKSTIQLMLNKPEPKPKKEPEQHPHLVMVKDKKTDEFLFGNHVFPTSGAAIDFGVWFEETYPRFEFIDAVALLDITGFFKSTPRS